MAQPLSSPELGVSELTPLSLQEADKMLTEHFNLIVKKTKIPPWGNTLLVIEDGVARIPSYAGSARRIQDEKIDADAVVRGIIERKGFDLNNPEKRTSSWIRTHTQTAPAGIETVIATEEIFRISTDPSVSVSRTVYPPGEPNGIENPAAKRNVARRPQTTVWRVYRTRNPSPVSPPGVGWGRTPIKDSRF